MKLLLSSVLFCCALLNTLSAQHSTIINPDSTITRVLQNGNISTSSNSNGTTSTTIHTDIDSVPIYSDTLIFKMVSAPTPIGRSTVKKVNASKKSPLEKQKKATIALHKEKQREEKMKKRTQKLEQKLAKQKRKAARKAAKKSKRKSKNK